MDSGVGQLKWRMHGVCRDMERGKGGGGGRITSVSIKRGQKTSSGGVTRGRRWESVSPAHDNNEK